MLHEQQGCTVVQTFQRQYSPPKLQQPFTSQQGIAFPNTWISTHHLATKNLQAARTKKKKMQLARMWIHSHGWAWLIRGWIKKWRQFLNYAITGTERSWCIVQYWQCLLKSSAMCSTALCLQSSGSNEGKNMDPPFARLHHWRTAWRSAVSLGRRSETCGNSLSYVGSVWTEHHESMKGLWVGVKV